MFVVISQILGCQYTLHAVFKSLDDALNGIEECLKDDSEWTTDNNAVDRGFNEIGRWVHPERRIMYTLHEEPVT